MASTPRKKKATTDKKRAKSKSDKARNARAAKRKREINGVGRPVSTLLAQEGKNTFTDRYLTAVKDRLKSGACAQAAGCDRTVVTEWEALAQEDFEVGRDTQYTRFVLAVREAMVERTRTSLKNIAKAERAGDWHASRWFLGLDDYVPKAKIEHSGGVKTGDFEVDDQDEGCAG